jgi:DNA invertase Pin-like site-specific DNA recombinase
MRRSSDSGAISRTRIRCAIYTRKSTEEGLDQDFNSLDAQREACASYINSQRHEGWTLLPHLYDDGGFSGGNMERPGLQRLLAEVKAGRVDVIVVYKVDRLTRSLTDFAKIVEVLDGAGASFVSVTQSFNTTTSMGRLTLNVLLSFAQFEREVIAERVRDKIAASKQKGMWMGGVVPLGYEVQDRKLIVVPEEAERVRHIMRRYLELRSVKTLMEDLNGSGIPTKLRVRPDGTTRGGGWWSRGALYGVLQNRLYLGEMPHRDKSYPAEHAAIVERDLFDQVQALLASNAVERKTGAKANHPSLLTGMIRDGQDRPLSPSHASKGKQRYRYYVSNEAAAEGRASAQSIMRLPAAELERAVIDAVAAMLDQAQPVHERWSDYDAHTAIYAERRCRELAKQIKSARVSEARLLLQKLDLQILIREEHVDASCSVGRLLALVDGGNSDVDDLARLPIEIRTTIRRRGKESRMVFEPPSSRPAKQDPGLIALLVKARTSRDELLQIGPGSDKRHRNELLRFAKLTYLAPDIVESILAGRQPDGLSARQLIRAKDLPLGWAEQRRRLGFA